MDDIIITRVGSDTAYLTNNSSASHYGITVLRLEGIDGIIDDYGPADTTCLPGNPRAAHIVAGWAMAKGRLPEEIEIARLYLSQWPDGPQVPHTTSAQVMGRKGGLAKSEKKRLTSRENGRKGGRPITRKGE